MPVTEAATVQPQADRSDKASAIGEDIERAISRIAPTWPLDRLIAVNPLWGQIAEPLSVVGARLATLSGSRWLMPRSWYRDHWQAGRLQLRHLRSAIGRASATCTPEALVAHLDAADAAAPVREIVSDVADAWRGRPGNAQAAAATVSWNSFVTHSISQSCAACFDRSQASLQPDRRAGLYPSWRRMAAEDRSPELLMGFADFRRAVRALPEDPYALIESAVAGLGIPAAERLDYFTCLLLRVNGWASWCAYLRWQAQLAGGSDQQIVHLLAVRLAWEWMLYRAAALPEIAARWQAMVARWPENAGTLTDSRTLDWLLQDAIEIAYQESVCQGLLGHTQVAEPSAPRVQAAFCIDVRSEVFRRALEAASPEVQTIGFAGFFGLPIEYRPLAAATARPQLPGLLAPQLRAEDSRAPAGLADRRALRLAAADAWRNFRQVAISGFTFVEAIGPFYAGRLVGNTLGRSRPVPHPEQAGLTPTEHLARKPRLAGNLAGYPLEAAAAVELGAALLQAMSLTRSFARLVLLAGHGSQTVNNAHAAALDCGACCGQTGEVNARVAAALLNDHRVRTGLSAIGIEIPATTHFLAALHDTTTDGIELFDVDEMPAGHAEDLAALRNWLADASARARAERAPQLGLRAERDSDLAVAFEARARDWSQLRPEWGLANNAAFIVAPRARTRQMDLAGRSFLHDYTWREDADFKVLELIMTAPMIVTHWINFQYYASMVDPDRYGSGNKLLHNVVGGHLGVFEGNGGDLRIGLPLQSLHDGSRWMHTPLRLSVFIEAPREAIDRVLASHPAVRQLVENGWLHLLQIDEGAGAILVRRRDGWMDAQVPRSTN